MEYSNKITYCTICLDNEMEVLARINEAEPYVDKVVVVDGGSEDRTMDVLTKFQFSTYMPVTIKQMLWKDDWSGQRNNCLKEVEDYSWVLSSDTDEKFSNRTFQRLRALVEMSEQAIKYDLFWMQSITVELDYKDVEVSRMKDQYWKAQLFFKEPETHFEGIMHERLFRTATEEHYNQLRTRDTYEHIKKYGVVWLRGHRNFFINGGGLNLREKQPLWLPFRQMIKDITGIESWHELNRYYIQGNIDQRIKDWFVDYRNHPLVDNVPEVREGYKAYFIYLHPEELTQELINTDPTGIDYASEIVQIHGPEVWNSLNLKAEVKDE